MIWLKLVMKFIVWVGLMSFPHYLLAQTQSSPEGRALVVVFKNGIPASEVAIKTPNQVLKTNSEGVISVTLPANQEHDFKVLSTNQNFKIKIVKDKETQVVVDLKSFDNKGAVEVKAPLVLQEEVSSKKNENLQSVSLKVFSSKKEPVSQATVLFGGVDTVFRTDIKGEVNTELPSGTYAVSVFHTDYQTYNLRGVEFSPNFESMTVTLKPAKNQLDDVVVLAPKVKGNLSTLVEVRKQSSAVTDVLGAEQMTRAGDSDAAASLRRVTGLTLVGGKYVYVRGLGERYSGVQMNSFSLPSPEPARRVVPLDLFPTSVMESIVVQKSYSPDLPGEFGGGIIQLQTKSLPEKFFFRSAFTAAYENAGDGLSYQGGGTDWLGMDDGSRAMPASIQNAINQGRALEVNTVGFNGGVSEQELVNMSQSLSNNYELTQSNGQALPGISVSTGNGWKTNVEDFGQVKLGISGSMLYGQGTDQLVRDSKTVMVAAGDTLVDDSYRRTNYTETETRLAGSFDVGLELAKKHKITASTFILRNTTNLAQLSRTKFVSGNPTDTITMDFIERELWTRHLKGEHELGEIAETPIKMDWRWGFADATRDSLDRRELSYDVSGSSQSLLNDSTRRSYSALLDVSEERALNFTVPIEKNNRDFIKLKFGILSLDKQRDSSMNRFMFISKNPSADYNSGNVAYGPGNMGSNGYLLNNISANSTQADNYTGTQNISAQYAMMDVSPLNKWSFQMGMRHETSDQRVRTYNYTDPLVDSSLSTIAMNDFLPSYGVVWKPTDKIRARLTYSETLARPDFREMSPVGFTDDETGYIVSGNPNLKGTVITNIDHRWEYYFTTDEYASVGVFYKNFENPIEAVFLSGPNRIQSFQNAQAANNYGIEFEGRIGARHFSRYFRRFTLLSNLSLIDSEIEISPENASSQTSDSRPLQGQSPYVVNLQVQYDRPIWGFSATVLYNIIGERITEVGVNGIPDTYEQPFGQLDLVATQKIQDNWTLSFRARNLLNPVVEATQSSEVVRSIRRGRTFAVVLGGVF